MRVLDVVRWLAAIVRAKGGRTKEGRRVQKGEAKHRTQGRPAVVRNGRPAAIKGEDAVDVLLPAKACDSRKEGWRRGFCFRVCEWSMAPGGEDTPLLLAGMALSRWGCPSVLDEVWLCFTGQIAYDEVTRNRARLMRGEEEDNRIADSLRTST